MTGKTALYCRVSTSDQNLERQYQQTKEYATDTLGVEPSAIEVYVDKQTGTDTDRDGYRELMKAVENGEVESVIASEVSRISRSARDFAATVKRVVDDNEVGLHILDIGIDLDPDERDPDTRAFLRMAAAWAAAEGGIKRENIREGIAASRAQGKWHARPPFGFDVGPEGYLSPNDDYETAVVILDELDKGASKRDLARRTSVARSTIQELAKHRERYVGEPSEPTESA